MNIDKAIKILTTFMKGADTAQPVDFDDATQLGLEALKVIQLARVEHSFVTCRLLPGETPIIDTNRSLHHIKETLQGTSEHP